MTWYEPHAEWTYADRRLFTVRAILLWIVCGFAVVDFVIFAFVIDPWWLSGGIVAAIGGLYLTWLIHRQVTAHAWAERDDDLIIKRGRLNRSVTVVPYGRMQFVEVHAGPLARTFGIARVQLHTASPGTDAHLSGVRAADAELIRDRITSRGEAKLAGL